MKQVKNAAEFKYDKDHYTVVWLFDQSSCHRKFDEHALLVKNIFSQRRWATACLRHSMGKTTPKHDWLSQGFVNNFGRAWHQHGSVCLRTTCELCSPITTKDDR